MLNLYKKENGWNIFGIVLGICILIAGIGFLLHPVSDYYSTSYSQAASFGADFYTLIYEAAQNAANNASATAHYVSTLVDAVNFYAGIAFVVTGALVTLSYIRKYILCQIAMEELSASKAPVVSEAEEENLPEL